MLETFARYIADATRLDLSVGGVNPAKTPLYIGELPESPPKALHNVVLDTSGASDPFRLNNRATLVQVITRSRNWEDAKAEAERAYLYLHGLTGLTISGWHVSSCRATAPPQYIGRDSSGMAEYSTNYNVLATKE